MGDFKVLKIGMFTRYSDERKIIKISRVEDIFLPKEYPLLDEPLYFMETKNDSASWSNIFEYSDNIVDLIYKGDIVIATNNFKYEVFDKKNDYVYVINSNYKIHKDNIKAVITKEQIKRNRFLLTHKKVKCSVLEKVEKETKQVDKINDVDFYKEQEEYKKANFIAKMEVLLKNGKR